MFAALMIIIAANRNRQGALLLLQVFAVLSAMWQIATWLEKFAFPPLVAAFPNIPGPPSSPITAAVITAFLAGFAAVKLYVSHSDPKDWGHPAHLIDDTYRKSSAWEAFMRNDKAGVNAVNKDLWDIWHNNKFASLWKKGLKEGEIRTAYVLLCRRAQAATDAIANLEKTLEAIKHFPDLNLAHAGFRGRPGTTSNGPRQGTEELRVLHHHPGSTPGS